MAQPGPGRPEYLRDFAGECVRRLFCASSVAETAFRDFLTFTALVKSWYWGSACIGTDSPAWSFQAIHEALRTEPCVRELTFRHICSAEIGTPRDIQEQLSEMDNVDTPYGKLV